MEKKKKTENFIKHELSLYPEERLVDLYKSCFQGYWGPGHLVKDSLSAMNYINYELNEMVECDTTLVYKLGTYDRYVRVNLSLVKNGKLPKEEFLLAFLRSANEEKTTSLDKWKEEWKYIISVVEGMDLTFENYEEDKEALNNLLQEGKYVMHHSEIFRQKYFPHYRVISVKEYEQLKQKYLQ